MMSATGESGDMQNNKSQSVSALAFTICLFWLAFPAASSLQALPPQVAASETIRILSYNIKHGQGMDDQVQLERAARLINELEPDLVALQEIDNGVRRTDGVDQAGRLGRLTEMNSVFGDFMDYQGGQYGMALLSRFPFAETTNHRLPPGAEPRSALAARILIGDSGLDIVLVGIHLYRTAEERFAQAESVVETFKDETTPVILAGDFNSTPDSDVIGLLGEHWTIPDKGEDNLTFSSAEPRREIDLIMYRPRDRFEVLELTVIDEPLVSDHRPVMLVVRLRR